ncbi:hypothetical protein BC938DRAFT_475722 [Jimgerdemannia flammicorona]|uniref:Uncharacterized protein n=1 Tax=Jimgerdemannia flammicorona TaxID=994334 RepID=A0A433QRD4_9FUNG|nr:hypothetical protein BC938DRAFT_475722 [Jimgerdemannia flammicorona]
MGESMVVHRRPTPPPHSRCLLTQPNAPTPTTTVSAGRRPLPDYTSVPRWDNGPGSARGAVTCLLLSVLIEGGGGRAEESGRLFKDVEDEEQSCGEEEEATEAWIGSCGRV